MFESREHGYRALLILVSERPTQHSQQHQHESDAEFIELVNAAGVSTVATINAPLRQAHAGTLLGKGKLEEVRQAVADADADLVLINCELTPVQERNIERAVCCQVLARTALILDIFAQRAATYEGKLQVELAQLRHLSTRLVRGWTHLERQKGGIGLRGPGETQLETDRRLLGQRIKQLKQRLAAVDKRRQAGRSRRQHGQEPVVALVGYTNAGKSTLFNRLTSSDVLVEDKLFATLDPTLRRWTAPQLGTVLLSDTVGFVSELPHDLVAAFRSTLQEAREADLLLHVIDGADADMQRHMDDVEAVLHDIDADRVPVLKVFNKADRSGAKTGIHCNNNKECVSATVSAVTGAGLDELALAVNQCLGIGRVRGHLHIPFAAAALRARLFALDAIEAEHDNDADGFNVSINIADATLQQLSKLPGEAGKVAAQSLSTGR